jgi:hypothetical protein
VVAATPRSIVWPPSDVHDANGVWILLIHHWSAVPLMTILVSRRCCNERRANPYSPRNSIVCQPTKLHCFSARETLLFLGIMNDADWPSPYWEHLDQYSRHYSFLYKIFYKKVPGFGYAARYATEVLMATL